MKDQIQQIILKYVYAMDEFDYVHTDIGGHGLAADELQALMCYREVKAFAAPYQCYALIEPEDVIAFLIKDYPESLILEAINKVKVEQ